MKKETKYYSRLGFDFFKNWNNGLKCLMGVNENKWAAYFSDGTVNSNMELDYYDLIDGGNWTEREYPDNWVQPKGQQLDIAAEIKQCLMNDGYGPTVAMLHTNEITESIFNWAYNLGKQSK